MTAEDYLKRYQQAQESADILREKYEEAVAEYDTVGSPALTDTLRVGISKPTERKVEKAQRLRERWRSAQIKALEIRQNTYAVIEALPCHEADILYMRYIQLMTWSRIEEQTGLTHQGVFRRRRRGLQSVQSMIDAGALDLLASDFDEYIRTYVLLSGK